VFKSWNQKTLQLVRSGKITGLRIDHIDGLWDPGCFLKRLQNVAGDGQRFYIVVEKILGRDEPLPQQWPVSGTTGYDFLNALNGVFVEPAGLARLQEIYNQRTGDSMPFAEVCYICNKLVMQKLFAGDVKALVNRLCTQAAYHREARDIPMSELWDAFIEV